MTLIYFKILHIIFMVSWFAGLFFLGRMLIYQNEAIETNDESIFNLTLKGAKRVWYIITLPSLILTTFFGLSLALNIGAFREGWMHLKLMFVLAFIFYNFYLNSLRIKLSKKAKTMKNWKMRLLNEVPFFFLVTIVFTVYMKNLFSGIWALLVVIMFASFISFLIYLKKRKNKI